MEAKVLQVECNIDNMNPEYYGGLLESLIENGAKDAWLTPIIMKKGRPGIVLSFLCLEDKLDSLTNYVFAHTTTIGLRYTPYERKVCQRQFKILHYKGLPVHVKVSTYNGQIVNQSFEFEDIARVSDLTGDSYKTIERSLYKELEV